MFKITTRIDKLSLFIFIIISSLSYNSFSQAVIIEDSLSDDFTACLSNVTQTVTIENISPYELSDVQIQLTLPNGVQYISGSTVGGTENTIISENSILFDLPNISSNTSNNNSITFTVQLFAECMDNYTVKKNDVDLMYHGDNGTGGTIDETITHESDLYNVLFPDLSLTNMTNQTYSGSIGDTVTRCLTIKNGGNGALSDFEIENIHGSQVNVLSADIGTSSTTPDGTLYELTGSDFQSIGNGDTLFDPGEEITICETSVFLGCGSDAQSIYKYRWGCNQEMCQELSDAANVIFESVTPDLKLTPWTSYTNNGNNGLGDNCYGNNANGDFPASLTIVNNGTGDAVNTIINVAGAYAAYNGWMYTNYYSSFNISSLTIEINGGGEQPITPDATHNGQNKPCLPADPKNGFDLNIPLIEPGDTVVIRWNHFTCGEDVGCNKEKRMLAWRYKGEYKDICDENYTISEQNKLPQSGSNYNYRYHQNLGVESVPGTMIGSGSGTLSFYTNKYSFGIPRSSQDQFKYRLILPDDCLNIDPNSIEIKKPDGTIQNYTPTIETNGDTIDYIFDSHPIGRHWTTSFDVSFDCSSCVSSGSKEIKLNSFYSPDSTCGDWLPMGCTSAIIDVICGNSCPGVNLKSAKSHRINYGLPDNNNDGLPDPGPLDMNEIRSDRLMYGDTLETLNNSVINNPNNDDFTSIVLKHKIEPRGNTMTYINSTITIYQASTGTYYSVDNIDINFDVTTAGGTRKWKHGFDIHSLPALGFPTGDYLQTGDSVNIQSFFVNTTNIGGTIDFINTQSDMDASENADFENATEAELLGCPTLHNGFNLIGYYYTTASRNSKTVRNCDIVTLSQNYYFSLGKQNYAGGNLFPYEYRHWSAPGDMFVEIPNNYEYISARFNFKRTTGTYSSSTSSWFNISPDNINGNEYKFDLYPFFGEQGTNPDIIFGDDGFHGTIQVKIRPTCKLEDGTQNTRYKWTYNPIPQLGSFGEVGKGWRNTDPVTYKGPDLSMQSNIIEVNSQTGQETFDLFFQNSSYESDVTNFWIAAPPSSGITADSILNTTTNTWYYPNGNGVFDVDDIPTDNSATYTLFTTMTSCTTDSIEVYSGWGCSGIPDSIQAYDCDPLSLTLIINPLTPSFESHIDYLETGNDELCDTLDFKITIRNYQLGYGFNMQTNIELPYGLQFVSGSSFIIYLGDTIPLNDPVNTSGNNYNWDLSNVTNIENGLTGIEDETKNSYIIHFRAIPVCGFNSGQRVFLDASGESFCGSNHVSESNYSQSIYLNNLSAPYTTDIKIGIDYITPCGPDNQTTLTVLNNGTNPFGNTDSISFVLPNGLTYDPNSFAPIHNASISQTEPEISTSGGETTLTWPLLPGVAQDDSMSFEINLSPDPNVIDCLPLELRAFTNVLLTATCAVDGNVCSAGLLTGESTKPIYVYNTDLAILSADGNVHLNADGSETLSGEFTVKNQGAALSDNYDLIFEVFQDFNGDGVINNADSAIWTQTENLTIGEGNTINIPFNNIPVSDFCSGVIKMSLADNPCFCTDKLLPINITTSATNFIDTICSGNTTTLSYPDIGGFSYNWSPTTDITSPSVPQPDFTQMNTGTDPSTYIFIRTIDKTLCQHIDTSTVVVMPEPRAIINQDTIVCQNDPDVPIAIEGLLGASPYSFDYTVNGAAQTGSGSPVLNVNQSTAVVDTFTYHLEKVTEGSSRGCSNQLDTLIKVIVNPLPTATIDGTIDVCQKDTEPEITFVGNDGTGPYTFTYTINDGSGSTTHTVVSTSDDSATVLVPTDNGGTFTYTLTGVEDASSSICSNTITGETVTITVNPLPTATIEGTTEVCQDGIEPQITFTGADGTAPYTFTYTIDGGTPQTVTTTNGNSVTVNAATDTPGTFVYDLISVQDNSSTNCSNNQTGRVTITVNPLPTASIEGTTEVCKYGDEPQITFTGANGTAPYTFTYAINGGPNQTVTSTNAGSVSVTAPTNTAGTFTYSLLSVEDNSSTTCFNVQTGTAIITVNPLPVAKFYPNPDSLNSYQWESKMVNESIGANDYIWDFGDGSSLSSDFSPTHSFPHEKSDTYTITLIATSNKGCKDTAQAVVIYEDELLFYVPNTFTPNGDGSNDVFKPVLSAGYDPQNYTLLIFNRWGEMIFESHNTNVGWDGTYNGKVVQDGTYVWKILVTKSITQTNEKFVGHVNVIK